MEANTHQQLPPVQTTPPAAPAQMQPAAPGNITLAAPHEKHAAHVHTQVLRIYSHSTIFFWWPVWVTGYVMALLTYWQGSPEHIEIAGKTPDWVHPSNNLGVIYFLVFFLVILITNFAMRGLASGMVVLTALLLTVVLAYVGWWDNVFNWLDSLKIHLTLGAYVWFSTLLFAAWVITVFGLDRLHYWEVTPGQLTHKTVFGAGSKSYNSQGMGLEKHRDDLFRHWLLGLGSGDLLIRTSGATRETIEVLNVLRVGSKVSTMQRLIAEVPEGPEHD